MMLQVLAVTLLVAADAPADDAVKKELDNLQGTWVATAGEAGGQTFLDDQLKAMKFVVQGNKYTFTMKETTEHPEKGILKPDPAPSPKALDIEITEGPEQGKTQKAIYELDGDTLKICFAQAGKDRPTEMSAKGEQAQGLLTFKREKR